MSNFALVSSADVSGIIDVKKYRSKETGLVICFAHVDGPLVNGYFCLATEAHDDDGLPHTLEHLVFMGSEEYPYKGMLDLFANRCLAQGTNAWTDTDHTCYTMTTAGSEGFLNLLPIYLDHVLYPTLTESGYITEVHHVNGVGEDAGVVYCEMQARENTGHSRSHLEFIRRQGPHCGPKKLIPWEYSETGGIVKNLRTTCSHEKVCNYHAAFYRPENLTLIITGNINHEQVFKAVAPFEEKIKGKPELPKYIRPWMSAVPPLEKNIDEKQILFPTEDESTGIVLIGWRGCNVSDYYTALALRMLFSKYLTETSVAPLQQALVEIEDPYCGDVSVNIFENKETAFCINADSVPKDKLFQVKDKVKEVILSIASGKEKIDMSRMETLIHRSILEEMNALEDYPHDTLAFLAIGDFLFSENDEGLQEYVDKIKRLKKLKKEPEEFWVGLLKKYVQDQKMVVVVADPSDELMQQMGSDEKERVNKQREALGEEGLKEKQVILDKAIAKNEVEPSKDIITKLSVPSTESITFHNIKAFSNVERNNREEGLVEKFPVDDFPVAFCVSHIKSFFTQIHVVIDTSNLQENLRMYLPLYSEILFESPVVKDGVIIPYEEVVNQLAADTLSTDASIGMNGGRFTAGSFSKLLKISITVENDKYTEGVSWIKSIFYDLQFSADRLKIVANKMINDVANHKRNGRRIVSSVIRNICFTKESNSYITNMVRQQKFLTQLVKDLEESSASILSNMESLRTSLLQQHNLRIYVAANLDALPTNPHHIWKEKMFRDDGVKELVKPTKVPFDSAYLSNKPNACAVGIGSVESSFLIQNVPGVDSFKHPDYPPLLVFAEYLCALEGPLWRQIRGLGLSYGYRMQIGPLTKSIVFILAKSTHIFKAFQKAKEITLDYISGKTSFEQAPLEAARSGTIFETIEKEQTISDAVMQNIVAEYKCIPPDYNRNLLKKLASVSIDDLKYVGEKYFSRLFDPEEASVAICCHPTKVDQIVDDFKGIGVSFQKITSLEDEFSL